MKYITIDFAALCVKCGNVQPYRDYITTLKDIRRFRIMMCDACKVPQEHRLTAVKVG